ncbi:hypothetical protein TPHA_0F01080 [Tetrapisispora phaffii CBS 4417]|uniref:Transaldolase n=1 Tax=Tetrapisispora phaffii (strain ATCC 24235 / CBS 4417 / NBRC 1672 / NRRL Y-8282 / UCD 70-5) TaxID=1071381 RepID=G8BV11_TETPH|nr:hypothetical protein TPHA_0F01080 [Tetrapisispora phaffii CBS 4417]CCE63593.1 hypothetical protein TPHA_0F01080 [Tetrapisispora phaffii CBS 4417]
MPVSKKQNTGSSKSGQTTLEKLRETGTTIVADTGDFEMISQYKPQDSTTNPTLILKASEKEAYTELVDSVIEKYVTAKKIKTESDVTPEVCEAIFDRILVAFGEQILKIVPGRVSTEVDAKYSFDKEGSINKAKEIIKLYEDDGISKERVLIKLSSTWEGIQAAKVLEKEYGIHVNCTLLFSFPQAVAAAEAGVSLISPFVGRIMDWYKNTYNKTYTAEDDPGVHSVRRIYNYYKKHGYKTIVMGASFRTVDELKALGGIDFLTISLKLLDELNNSTEDVTRSLDPETAKKEGEDKTSFINDESKFRFELNEDAMTTEKLAEGIRNFAKDAQTLHGIIKDKIISKHINK